jgi:hypothetical protein
MIGVIHDYKGRKIRIVSLEGVTRAWVYVPDTDKWICASEVRGIGAEKTVLAAAKDCIDQGKV